MAKKLVVVLGATGAQGNPTAKYLLKYSSDLFYIRAVTRDGTKPVAQELRSLGAEIAEADFDDEASIVAALDGAHAVFAITNFWDKSSYDIEVTQGKLVNKLASRLPHLETYIFSGLPDGRKLGGGRFQNILPYNAKTAIREDLESYPKLAAKTTTLFVAVYYQNWLKYNLVFGPQKNENGDFVLSMPYPDSIRVPSASANDTGVVVDTILRSGSMYHRKGIVLAADLITQNEMVTVWSNKLHIKTTFEQATPEQHKKRMVSNGLPEHLAVAVTELSETFALRKEAGFGDNVVQARDIIPSTYKLKSWEDYVQEEDWSPML